VPGFLLAVIAELTFDVCQSRAKKLAVKALAVLFGLLRHLCLKRFFPVVLLLTCAIDDKLTVGNFLHPGASFIWRK